MNNFLPKRRRMGKRGLSPLIATVLLVAFSIALGSVIMSWGKNLVETNADVPTVDDDGTQYCEKCRVWMERELRDKFEQGEITQQEIIRLRQVFDEESK